MGHPPFREMGGEVATAVPPPAAGTGTAPGGWDYNLL
jgi:hypothetical protein